MSVRREPASEMALEERVEGQVLREERAALLHGRAHLEEEISRSQKTPAPQRPAFAAGIHRRGSGALEQRERGR
jgi:hypothetical protein